MATTRSKLLFDTLTVYQYYKYYIFRLIALALIAGAYFLYDNNPVLMIIIAVVAAAVVLFYGEPYVRVYTDRIVYRRAAIISLSRKVIYLKDIKRISVNGEFDESMDVDSDVEAFRTKRGFFNESLSDSEPDPYNNVEIEYLDGTKATIKTHIYIDKLKKAVKVVASLFEKNK